MMIKPNSPRLSILFTLLLTQRVFAKSFGQIAKEFKQTTLQGASIIHIICVLLGIGLITGGLIRIRERRMNSEVSWGSILVLLIFGLACIAVAFIPMPKG